MNTRFAKIIIALLAIVIIVMAWFLFATPASAPTVTTTATTTSQTASSSSTSPTQPAPLDQSVVVTSPLQNATVSHTFTVAGQAPNVWFNEAVFPIQVRDANDDVIGAAQGQAQGDWTVQGPVTFTSEVTVDASYEGPATLILLKDNPSGLPQNDDSVTIPITIQ